MQFPEHFPSNNEVPAYLFLGIDEIFVAGLSQQKRDMDCFKIFLDSDTAILCQNPSYKKRGVAMCQLNNLVFTLASVDDPKIGEEYNIPTNSWKTLPLILFQLEYPSSVEYHGFIYLSGCNSE